MMTETTEKDHQEGSEGGIEPASLEVHGVSSQHTSRHGSVRSEKSKHCEDNSKAIELTVAGEEVSKVVVPNAYHHIDLLNRDPEHIHQHLKVAFEEIFAEPHPTIFSFDTIWRLSFQIFSTVKLWTYRILSLICAIPAVIIWAINFACLAFCHIWCCMPCFRLFMINMSLAKKYFEVYMDCCISPICLAIGQLFSSIRVSVVQTSDYHHLPV